MLKGLLRRPLGLKRVGLRLRVVLLDRRRSGMSTQPLTLSQLRAELRERLLTPAHGTSIKMLRHLALVHEVLGRKGWEGVEALPAPVLGKALSQAEMLADVDASAAMESLITTLRVLQEKAALRDELLSEQAALDHYEQVEVQMATQEEYEALERTWSGTRPAALGAASRD